MMKDMPIGLVRHLYTFLFVVLVWGVVISRPTRSSPVELVEMSILFKVDTYLPGIAIIITVIWLGAAYAVAKPLSDKPGEALWVTLGTGVYLPLWNAGCLFLFKHSALDQFFVSVFQKIVE